MNAVWLLLSSRLTRAVLSTASIPKKLSDHLSVEQQIKSNKKQQQLKWFPVQGTKAVAVVGQGPTSLAAMKK